MKKFSDFGIKIERQNFIGEKVKVGRVLNRKIMVHGYKIENSKYYEKGSGKCLYLQITLDGVKHVLFNGSANLIQQIELVPKEAFPFETTIVEDDRRLDFT